MWQRSSGSSYQNITHQHAIFASILNHVVLLLVQKGPYSSQVFCPRNNTCYMQIMHPQDTHIYILHLFHDKQTLRGFVYIFIHRYPKFANNIWKPLPPYLQCLHDSLYPVAIIYWPLHDESNLHFSSVFFLLFYILPYPSLPNTHPVIPVYQSACFYSLTLTLILYGTLLEPWENIPQSEHSCKCQLWYKLKISQMTTWLERSLPSPKQTADEEDLLKRNKNQLHLYYFPLQCIHPFHNHLKIFGAVLLQKM